MRALMKVEWIKLWREWPVFILAIGMPLGFFLFYSGMDMYEDPQAQKAFVQSYMLTMTAFSMSSFGFFSFPAMLFEDQKNHWLIYLEHANIRIFHYYLSKIFRVFINFACSILVTFLVAAYFRGVDLSMERWIGSALLLLVTGVVFLAFGLLIAQIPSPQMMSIVGNIAFLLLAIIGGSWMPVSTFPAWMQRISKLTPTYHVNQVITEFAGKGDIKWQSLFIVAGYAIMVMIIALWIQERKDVSS
ncbi:ABC transporter permease [Streptococcus catagoni]|uniref:ABC transporter permease n=1 Tax=Streptococcus catagoni TaxID=2654874 RepID=UPI00140C9D32|nr:ABC transporter permease [Streptococcus catagoni]